MQYFERGLLHRSAGVVMPAPLGRQLMAGRHFSPGTYAVDPVFAPYYASHDGHAVLGVPLAPAYPETNGDGSGSMYLMQWFENGRLEYHPLLPVRYRVLPGLVGRQALRLARRG
jgi:hypothetical protein